MQYSTTYKNKPYQNLIGPYFFGPWSVPQIYINGIIDTGYKDRYGELLDQIKKGEMSSVSEMYKDPEFEQFITFLANDKDKSDQACKDY